MGKNVEKEYIYLLLLFLLSCLHRYFIYVFLILIFLKMREGSQGFLKICLLYTLRQCIDFTRVATMTGGQSNLKQILILIAALWVCVTYLKKRAGKIPRIILTIAMFGSFASMSAVFFSSYPLAGAMKVVNFIIVLIAIVLASIESKELFNIEQYMFILLTVVMIVSFCVIPYPGAYVNGSVGRLFKGIWNHPNDFGIICAIYLAILMVHYNKILGKQLVQMGAIFLMIFLSKSRGAMLAGFIILLVYFMVCRNIYNRKTLLLVGLLSILLVVITPVGNDLESFFLKGNLNSNKDIFSSRSEVIEIAKNRFDSNPICGRGLLIPYISGMRSLSFNIKGIEPGNIFLELLAGTGIIGLMSFTYLILQIFRKAQGKYKIYPIAIVAASISEVSFFSVNNYGVIYYMLLSFSILSFYINKETKNEIL